MCCRKTIGGGGEGGTTQQPSFDAQSPPPTPSPISSLSGAAPESGGETSSNGEPTGQVTMLADLGWLYEQVEPKYELVTFGRFQDWEGSTYSEAADYCSSVMASPYEPCGYDALCPNGLTDLSDESITAPAGDIWVPIDETEYSWFELGEGGYCAKRTTLPYSVDATRYALCCAQQSVVPVVPTSDVAPSPTPPTLSDADYDDIYKATHERYNPEEHNRSSGWMGQNYTAALEFCAKMQSKVPCPYEALCPLGTAGAPIVGKKDGSNGVWAPIIDTANGWVQIGQKNSCSMYNDMNPHPPQWGWSGLNNEAITQYIVCCDELNGQISADEGGPKAASTRTEEIILDTMHPVWFGKKHGYHGAFDFFAMSCR